MDNLILHNESIQNIAVVDDVPEAREAMLEIVSDAGFSGIPFHEVCECSAGEFGSIITEQSQAAVFDHNLTLGGYADFKGAEVVEYLYDRKFPAILLTQVDGPEIVNIGYKRKKIPYFLDGANVEANQIRKGLERCIKPKFQPILA